MKQKNKFKKGFSLVEMLIAIFIFSLVSTMLASSLSNFLKTYMNFKRIQRDTENAQYAMNLMAKTLRTSAVEATNGFPLRSYDYSQGECIEFSYVDKKKIQVATTTDVLPAGLSACNWGSMNGSSDLTSDSIVSAVVSATPTVGSVLGIATVSLGVSSGTTSPLPIQMSVSLRQ